MKKVLALCLSLVLVLLLAACSDSVSNSGELASSEWSSNGRAYKQSGVNLPGDYNAVFSHNADFYISMVYCGNNEPERYEICKNGTDALYSPENTYIDCAAGNDEGIWLVESETAEDDHTERLKLLSYSGDTLKTVDLASLPQLDGSVYTIRCASDLIYLRGMENIVAVDNSGRFLYEYKLRSSDIRFVVGNDGKAYLAYYSDEGFELFRLDGGQEIPIFTSQEASNFVYSGNEEFFLLMANETGLYGLNEDGSSEPIIIWNDCEISISRIMTIIAMPNGEFLLFDAMGASRLSPAEPAEMHRRITLTLATAGNADLVRGQVMLFNQSNSDYYIEIKDYSENGAYDNATAITRMNTDLISGNYPDIIQLTDVSPYSLIKRGYLADMCALLEDDPDMSIEDITIADQLMVGDGIYFIDREFYMDTRVGYYSDFGDVYGWTFEKYLEVEKNAPADMEMMYNTTRASLLRRLCSRYMQNAVDWQSSTCDFDNADFVAILEAISRIKETPEPENPQDCDFTPTYVRMKEGTLYTAAAWIGGVQSLADQEKQAGCKLSVIGYPTVDGSCGTDIGLSVPIGICSQSNNISGGWAYIKYLLTVAGSSGLGMPVYAPYFQEQIDEALSESSEDEVKLTQADVDRFETLLSNVKTVAIYDETILDIIESETAPFFAGQKTAKETAKIVQSKISLYVAEQG